MNKYIIATDSTCDLNINIINKYDIKVIPMSINLNEMSFEHYPDFRNYSCEKFFEELDKGAIATTSQITPQKYLDFFTPYLKEGYDILYICFSSALSSTYNSSLIARNQLEEDFDNKIYIVDSLCASGGEGLLVNLACINKENNFDIEENYKKIESLKLKINHYFTVDDLMHLKRGGRISSTSAIIGNALKIKPILCVNNEGKLINIHKAHGRKSSLNFLLNKIEENIEDTSNIFVTHAMCSKDVEFICENILKKYPDANITVSDCGPVVGAHTGKNLLCVFFVGKTR